MSKQDVIDYVMNTPHNTNPAILGQKLDEMGGGATEPYVEYKLNDSGRISEAALFGFEEIPSHFFYNTRTGSYGYNALEKIDFSGSPNLKSIGTYAFYYDESLKSIEIPDSVYEIANNAFARCTGATTIHLPLGCTIMDKAFAYCNAVEHLEITAGTLYGQCFQQCAGLKSVWIREECKNILSSTSTNNAQPFLGCPSDLVIYVERSSKRSNWNDTFAYLVSDGSSVATVVYNQTTCPW